MNEIPLFDETHLHELSIQLTNCVDEDIKRKPNQYGVKVNRVKAILAPYFVHLNNAHTIASRATELATRYKNLAEKNNG